MTGERPPLPPQLEMERAFPILRRHLVEKEPISKLCDEQGLQPTVFYSWQQELFENGAVAFQTKARANHQANRNGSGWKGSEKRLPRMRLGVQSMAVMGPSWKSWFISAHPFITLSIGYESTVGQGTRSYQSGSQVLSEDG